jgi:hypothetical protein
MKRVISAVVIIALAMLPAVVMGKCKVSFVPDEQKPFRIVISNDQGTLIFQRGNWQTMTLKTAKGKQLSIVDLLFYNASIKDNKPGYWPSPKNWETNPVIMKVIKNDDKECIVSLHTQCAGVTKQVYITIPADKSMAFVVNRLIAEKDATVAYDFQSTWASSRQEEAMYTSDIIFDGQIKEKDSGKIEEYCYFYRPKCDAGYGIFLPPSPKNKIKQSCNLEWNTHKNGVQITMSRGSNLKMKAGDILEQRYAIYWGDGRQINDAEFMARDFASGKYNSFFYAPDKKKISYSGNSSPELKNEKWEKALNFHVPETTSGAPVKIKLDSSSEKAFAVLDSQGMPKICQGDDTDGDGKIDEIVFLPTVKEKAKYTLLTGKNKSISLAPSYDIRQEKTGSWRPIRMSPTVSNGAFHESSSISRNNQYVARKQIAELQDLKPMTVLENKDFRFIIGNDSGLIEAAYPKALRGFDGSYFREFIPDWKAHGKLQLVSNGPVRTVLLWQGEKGSSRIISIYSNGFIESKWKQVPRQLQLITSAHPYRFMATGNADTEIVRFSQMIEKKRKLPAAASKLVFFGFIDLSLLCSFTGFKPVSEEIWMDSGEIMYELGSQMQKKYKTSNPDVRKYVYPVLKKLCRTYIGGGIRIVKLDSVASNAQLSYKFGQEGSQTAKKLSQKTPEVVIPASQLTECSGIPAVKSAEKNSLEIEFPQKNFTAIRIFPNHFNGWKLRPLVRNKQNPLPGFFPIKIVNNTPARQKLSFELKSTPEIMEAQLLSGQFKLKDLTDYSKSCPVLAPHKAELYIAPGEIADCLLRVRLKEDTLGKYPLLLKWNSNSKYGSVELNLTVNPESSFFVQQCASRFSPQNYDMMKHFNNLVNRGGIFWLARDTGKVSPEKVKYIHMLFREYQRVGLLISEYFHYSHYLRAYYSRNNYLKMFRLPPAEFLKAARKIYRDYPELDQYRSHLHTGDEIWEIIGSGTKNPVQSLDKTIKEYEEVLKLTDTPAYNSFMIHGVDDGFPAKIPNDVAYCFCYSGSDEAVKRYADKLRSSKQALFEQWCKNPELLKQAGTRNPKPLHCFWMSARLHQDDYNTIMRHLWWLRHNGFDNQSIWAMASWNIVYGNIGDWSAMATGYKDSFILTDRSLAIMDGKVDMALIALYHLLKQKAEPSQLKKLNELEKKALALSQGNEFGQARECYAKAVKMLRPDLDYLLPQYYFSRVDTVKLPDPNANWKEAIAEAKVIPSIHVPLIDGRNRPVPVVDGKLDNAYLEEAGFVNNFRLIDGGPGVQEKTQAYIARDKDNLYLFFVCSESQMDKIQSRYKEHDSGVYNDDSVEIFIRPDMNKKLYYHFIVSAANVTFESKNHGRRWDLAWNPKFKTAITCGKKAWMLEAAIPFSEIGGAPKPGAVWRMNFCRNEKSQNESTSWSAAFGSFHNLKRFGKVQF